MLLMNYFSRRYRKKLLTDEQQMQFSSIVSNVTTDEMNEL